MKVFKEEQRFIQSWIIVPIGISVLILLGIIINEYTEHESNMKPLEFAGIIGLILTCIIPVFIIKLTTKIDEVGIHYQFSPIHLSLRTISWLEIKKATIRNYDPISEYGGWGLKGGAFWNKKKGIAINVFGNIGIQLELKNGKKILIGTQNKTEAQEVLSNYESKLLNNESN